MFNHFHAYSAECNPLLRGPVHARLNLSALSSFTGELPGPVNYLHNLKPSTIDPWFVDTICIPSAHKTITSFHVKNPSV